jgi:IS30 family transposase
MKEKVKKYSHFNFEERTLAYEMRACGKSLRDICERLGRPVTAAGSLSREFARNRPRSPKVTTRRGDLDVRAASPLALALIADEYAKRRRALPRKRCKLASDLELKEFVELALKDDASPRDVRWRVRNHFGDKSISVSTIYAFTKGDKGLIGHLRQKGKARQQRLAPRKKPKNYSVTRRRISERSAVVNERQEYGHFEADTSVSPRGGSKYAILSIRERLSRHRWFSRLPDLCASSALAVLRGFFSQIPPSLRGTLTVDNGTENAELHQLEGVFEGFQVYYCDPYSAWQRGSVENANGEFRWYFPKGTDFKDVSPVQIQWVQDKLNRRCMDCLGGQSAAKVYRVVVERAEAGVVGVDGERAEFRGVSLRREGSSGLYLP